MNFAVAALRKPRQSPLLIAGVAALLTGFAALALAASWTATPRAVTESVEELEGDVAASPQCAECGVVRSVLRLAPVAGATAVYQITVRLESGESHVFNDAEAASWRPGERMILIAGRTPRAK
jgi:hypothetical protein